MSDEGSTAEPEQPEDEAEAAEDPAPQPAPPKRRKKRRKRPRDDSPEVATNGSVQTTGSAAGKTPSSPYAAPAFARGFPKDPALDALVAAFDAGDYARVRREAPALAKRTDRDDVRAAARELARRLDPDPLAVYLLAGAAALLVFLAAWYWSHPHVP